MLIVAEEIKGEISQILVKAAKVNFRENVQEKGRFPHSRKLFLQKWSKASSNTFVFFRLAKDSLEVFIYSIT